MTIARSVGVGGRNDLADVKRLQLLLNMAGPRYGLAAPLIVDGGFGPKTLSALDAFQRAVMGVEPQRHIDPDSPVLLALKGVMPAGFVAGKLWAIMIHAVAAQIERYFMPLVGCMARNGIDTPLRTAHFLAQLGHESGDLRFAEELADGRAYQGRADLGNTEPGDGPRFKGRGLIQLTGRANYRAYGQARGRNFLTDASARLIATDPELAADVAGWFWSTRNLNPLADADQIRAITRRINGGYNGLADRQAHLDQAKWHLL